MARSSSPANEAPFGERYFQQFYGHRETRVAEPADGVKLGRFIAAYAGLLELPVRSILDVGAGTGRLRRPLLRAFPGASYLGTAASEYACAKYGWQHCSILDLDRGSFDFVMCNDVLQSLDRGDAARAIDRLAARCRGLLYFAALTREDWQQNCDQSRTDPDVHLRSTRWYAQRLGRAFRNLGGGLFVRRDAPVVIYSLHALD